MKSMSDVKESNHTVVCLLVAAAYTARLALTASSKAIGSLYCSSIAQAQVWPKHDKSRAPVSGSEISWARPKRSQDYWMRGPFDAALVDPRSDVEEANWKMRSQIIRYFDVWRLNGYSISVFFNALFIAWLYLTYFDEFNIKVLL